MITFRAGGHRFHLRAAAVLRRGGDVLLHRADGDDFWALPGGRVDAGETAAEAVEREMREELHTAVRATRLAFVVENFFALGGETHHEVGLYFHAEAAPDSVLVTSPGPYHGHEGERSLTFAWYPAHGLARVTLVPAFLVEALASSTDACRHVVNRDAHLP